ncbi:MAG: amidohydrolase family protein [Chloroflexi bacterium]|nr:amidohydrolase family protein [Chloroflexota bacterium]
MPELDLVLRGGTLCTASETARADVGIGEGRIVQIGGEMQARQEVDATGKLLLPGGVDAHVHLSNPTRDEAGPRWVDDFSSGSAAALAGGVTCVGNMSFPGRGGPNEGPLATLERETRVANETSLADVFLHPVISDPTPTVLDEIPHLLDAGCSSIKIFMSNAQFDQQAVSYVEAIRRAGAASLLSMLHCEDFSVMQHATDALVKAGKTSLRYFAESRPVAAEVLATQRAVAIAEVTNAPVYLVHLSSERALEVCADAQARGLAVYVETRPLYLYLTSERLLTADGPLYIGQPPLREQSDIDALWAGLRQGTIQTVCTDHAPWSRDAKMDPSMSITKLRPGVENLQTLVPMLYSEGVRKGRISLQRFVELTSTNAARLFGLYPRKGTLAIGSDADIVVFDPELERTIEPSMLKSNADYSVYEGWRVTGWPVISFRRGEAVFREDAVIAEPGSGVVLACGATARL